jgi:hypothetical protein
MAFNLSFDIGQNKRSKTEESTSGASASGNTLTTTTTAEGIDLLEVITRQAECITLIDRRLAQIENTAYITIKTNPESKWVKAAKEGTKAHEELVTQSRKKSASKEEKAAIGPAFYYVAYNWIKIINELAQEKKITNDVALEQLKKICETSTSIHDMKRIFSHAAAWITRDKKIAYVRYKMLPWVAQLEVSLTDYILSLPDHTLDGSPAPINHKVYAMNESLGKDGRGAKSSRDD